MEDEMRKQNVLGAVLAASSLGIGVSPASSSPASASDRLPSARPGVAGGPGGD
jgi:hypothetical protein